MRIENEKVVLEATERAAEITSFILKENGLEVQEDVAPISARLIVNTASMKMRKKELEKIISQIQEAIE